jgi:hypothetical protein
MHFLRRPSAAPLPSAVLALEVAACASLAIIGADSRWLAALGGTIVRSGTIPAGIPYAAAPSQGWHNVPVLAELVFHALDAALGDRGLIVAQVGAVSVALGAVAWEGTRDARSSGRSVLVLRLVPAAAASAFLNVRAQLFSLALFPLLVLLLRSEARTPSRRIWLVVPLIALWSNLHGAVLIGVVVAACYLLLARLRSSVREATAVLAASVAVVFATPAGIHTAGYYLGVMGNVYASSHAGAWARPSLSKPLDLVFLALVVPLAVAAARGRPQRWEVAAAAALAAAVAAAGRNEVWLVLFLAPLAARGIGRGRPLRLSPAVVAFPMLVASAWLVLALVRAHPQPGAGPALRRHAIAAAAGTPILADPIDAETLALAGATVVIGDPIDAFDPRDQRLYADWLRGSPTALGPLAAGVRVVLAGRGSDEQRTLADNGAFCAAGADRQSVLYVRRDGGRCRRSVSAGG